MANTYTPAPELASFAEPIIAEHHDHLDGIRIAYVWRSEAIRRRDHLEFGKASKISGLSAFLSREPDASFELVACGPPDGYFVIEVFRQGWDGLNDAQRAKVLDGLLSFCAVDEVDKPGGGLKKSLRVVAPDVYEFSDVSSRHPKAGDLSGVLVRAVADVASAKKSKTQEAVIGVNGKPVVRRGRKKKDYASPKAGVSKEQRSVGGQTFTLAVTPDGTEFQFMIAVRDTDGEDRICVAGRRADTVEAAKLFFEEYIAEHEVGATA